MDTSLKKRNSIMNDLPKLMKDILNSIRSGKTLSATMFDVDINAVISKREGKDFESELVLRLNKITEIKRNKPKSAFDYIEDFVEEIFVHVFQNTNSDDLSAYISDDFGMFFEAMHMKIEDEWLNGLISVYADGEIPCDLISPLKGKFYYHILKLSKV